MKNRSAAERGGLSRRNRRGERGNMIVLIGAITIGIVVALIFFCLNYSRLLGSNAEQKKAIESAALAAATDLSQIVIDTKEFGFVSLSDQAPIGSFTAAGDKFYMPVHGINTLMATARLDAIIADQLATAAGDKSTVMGRLAYNDFLATQSCITQLTTVLQGACTAKGSPQAKDRDGNTLDVYHDAENAYTQNCIRMTGSSNYVAGSMKLSMGELTNPADTNTSVPLPTSASPVAANLQQNNNYKSFVEIPYKSITSGTTMKCIFGAIGSSTRLVDVRDFVTAAPGLSYHVPTIVKAEADQLIKTSQTPNGAIFHSAACAEPSNVFDPKPAPGALAIEFPDGKVPDITSAAEVFVDPQLNAGNADVLTSAGGDFPDSPGSSLIPVVNYPIGSPSIADVWRVTVYDWIRRGGSKADIKSVVSMLTTPFNPSSNGMIDWWTELSYAKSGLTNVTSILGGKPKIPFGIMYMYKFDPAGMVSYKWQPVAPYPYEVVSNNQVYGEFLDVFKSKLDTQISFLNLSLSNATLTVGQGGGGGGGGNGNGNGKGGGGKDTLTGDVDFLTMYDIYVRDQSRALGNQSGGLHGGEPLDDPLVATQVTGANRIALSKQTGKYSSGDYGAGGTGAGNGNGGGLPPMIAGADDFGDLNSGGAGGKGKNGGGGKGGKGPGGVGGGISPPRPVIKYATGGGKRLTYQTTGLSGSIRFRRQIQLTGTLTTLLLGLPVLSSVSTYGYLGAKPAFPSATYTVGSPSIYETDDFQDR